MNPIERPRSSTSPLGADLALDVEAADWPGLLAAVSLSVSDAIHPLGDFKTWTARRVTAKAAGPAEVLERVVTTLLADFANSAFLPALLELDKVEPSRVSVVHRGGCLDEDDPVVSRPRFAGVVPGATQVTPGVSGTAWRARVVLRPNASSSVAPIPSPP